MACALGYHGFNCNKICPPGYYGDQCAGSCFPNCSIRTCHHVHGCLKINTEKSEPKISAITQRSPITSRSLNLEESNLETLNISKYNEKYFLGCISSRSG
uniref:Scavenger receptor class F member 2-like n=1 Tax=Crassostrea virginica TaxID=6565 RepID=A0A8B8AVQ8_CRAVI|nr:scavenger receptor class F member 2-like [Crassostrea virginica]